MKRKDGHVLPRALELKVEDQWKKGRQKMTWNKQVEEESKKIGLSRDDGAHCRVEWAVCAIHIVTISVESGNPHMLGIPMDLKYRSL